MSVAERDFREVARTVFELTLGRSVETHRADPRRSYGPGAWNAAIDISGEWHGTVRLALPRESGHHIAGAMLHVAPTDAAGSAVRDAVGELVNMIGGNLKALLPGPCVLSIPTVESSTVPADRAASDEVVDAVAIVWEDQTATVSLLRHVGAGDRNTLRPAEGASPWHPRTPESSVASRGPFGSPCVPSRTRSLPTTRRISV